MLPFQLIACVAWVGLSLLSKNQSMEGDEEKRVGTG